MIARVIRHDKKGEAAIFIKGNDPDEIEFIEEIVNIVYKYAEKRAGHRIKRNDQTETDGE